MKEIQKAFLYILHIKRKEKKGEFKKMKQTKKRHNNMLEAID